MLPASFRIVASLLLFCFSYISQSSAADEEEYADTRKVAFPPHFWFGVSTASYQVEGAWNVGGKSKNIWDVYTHTPGNIKDNSTGDNACRSYEYSDCDLEMLRYLDVTFYRFSISWSRILPEGFPHKVNQEGIDYYQNILEDLLMSGIHPVVTIFHWDLPQCLQDLGGWANPHSPQWMEDYARVLFQNFGDKVNTWITINEPRQIIQGYGSDQMAPGIKGAHGIGEYMATKNLILAHAKVYHMYQKEFRPKQGGGIGIAISADYNEPLTDSAEDKQAASDAFDFNVGMFADPIYSPEGGFPARVKELVEAKSLEQGFQRSRLIDFTEEEKKFCKDANDFFGLNHYSTKYWTRSTYKPGKDIPSLEDDLGAKSSFKNYPRTASEHIAVIPHGMRETLKLLKERYRDPLFLITENGVATDEDLEDPKRIDYIQRYLRSMLDAIYIDDVQIQGYAAWSLMDNFEWKDGYKPKFGLFKVDHNDPKSKRQARLSAIWYKKMIATGTLDRELPEFETVEYCN